MSAEIGVGLPKVWQLRDDHRFYPAAVYHDASQDAVEIFEGRKKLPDYLNEDYPKYYVDVLASELERLDAICQKAEDRKQAVLWYIYDSDKRFKQMCDKLARNSWERLQAKAFYAIVKTYTLFKYGKR
jgi:hypothetical protein